MKVYLHYNECAAESLRQTLKVTLPKKWENGPAKNLIETFVKNYNEKHPMNQLDVATIRLETEMREVISQNAVVSERINDRQDLYVKVGQSPPQVTPTFAETGVDDADRIRTCRNFGCNKKYTLRTNFEGECRYHTKPPVFHETAKYWSCCPHKKAYDWESFMEIKGCATGLHSDIKPGGNQFLGGQELRGQDAGKKLKTVEDFNREQRGDAPPVAEKPIDLLKRALVGVGVSAQDFDAAKQALMAKFADDESEVLAEFATEFGFGLHNLIGTTGDGPPPTVPP
ncbi:hypothetical protein CTAYLR_002207 [Chrysophaeum taylorii]|uniref:CHORD domain-containing protein n=1 Tax=Chrysophaeum taylorii TaxID=2483200 RepID=A0AAD7UP06_9STRA|nr:hypothetical protein CTAYLR_002207 [Chrysophaeum taylorii]